MSHERKKRTLLVLRKDDENQINTLIRLPQPASTAADADAARPYYLSCKSSVHSHLYSLSIHGPCPPINSLASYFDNN